MFRQLERLAPLTIRHSKVASDNFAIKIVQSHNWQYFIETLLQISNGDLNIEHFYVDDENEFDKYLIIEKTFKNLNYCKNFYQEVFDDISYFFYEKIRETPDEFLQKMEEDFANEIYYTKKLKEIDSHVKCSINFTLKQEDSPVIILI